MSYTWITQHGTLLLTRVGDASTATPGPCCSYTSTTTSSATTTTALSAGGSAVVTPVACNTAVLDWAALVLSIIVAHVTWWIGEIPFLWKASIWEFLSAIGWNCMRLHMPAVTAMVAHYKSNDVSERGRIYYFGVRKSDDASGKVPSLSKWRFFTVLSSEVITFATSILTLYQDCTLTPDQKTQGIFSFATWTYPSLPAAIIGLSFLISSRFKFSKIAMKAFTFVALAVICILIALLLWQFKTPRPNKDWWLPTVMYVCVAFPLPYAILPAWFGRVGGLGLAMKKDSFPFCSVGGKTGGTLYLIAGAAPVVVALFGFHYHGGKWSPRGQIFVNRMISGQRERLARDMDEMRQLAIANSRKESRFTEMSRLGYRWFTERKSKQAPSETETMQQSRVTAIPLDSMN